MDNTSGFPASNRSRNHMEGSSNCILRCRFVGWKNCREWKMGNDSDDGTPTNGDMVNWITPTDSPCRIGLETTSKGVLIVAWGAACGGEKIAVRYHANNYSDSRREDMVKPMPLRDSSHLIGPKTTLDEVLIVDGSTLWRGNITAR